jgi:hypothetical protein
LQSAPRTLAVTAAPDTVYATTASTVSLTYAIPDVAANTSSDLTVTVRSRTTPNPPTSPAGSCDGVPSTGATRSHSVTRRSRPCSRRAAVGPDSTPPRVLAARAGNSVCSPAGSPRRRIRSPCSPRSGGPASRSRGAPSASWCGRPDRHRSLVRSPSWSPR